jgi:fructose-1,6-bisphosphatase/inositol monophosphatase family enzyme
MDERLKVAMELAKEAAKIIHDNFGKMHAVELKDDRSPVTAVDKRINRLIAVKLKEYFPADALLGEEESYGSGDEQYKWVCDPLDGTKAFILDLPFSVFMLGLSQDGRMLLSVVSDPFSGKLYHAVRGKGAFCDGKPIQVSDHDINEGYALLGPDSFPFESELKRLSIGVEPVPGTGYKCIMIASGYGIGMINQAADFHDMGPGSLLVDEAGGRVTGLRGERLDYSKEIGGVVVSNGRVHDDFIRIAASAREDGVLR